MDKVSEYIKNNWVHTFHPAKDLTGSVKIDHPYTSPCVADFYTEMFYWDTYFINIGLMLDGFDEQVENNLDNIAKFINTLGFMPNANYITDRSQPPLFTRAVYEFYMHTSEKRVIKKYFDTILKEHNFWTKNRTNKIGLSSYGTHGDEQIILQNYEWHHLRVQESRDAKEEQIVLGKDIMAIAESGLDFNMRFRTKESKVSAHDFSHLDLDCILYDMEKIVVEFAELLGRNDIAKQYEEIAEKRKILINKYYLTKDGIYLDYNMKTGGHSEVLSAVSLYPYTFGVSDDKKGALKVLNRLELKYGISACEYRGEDIYFQWDYPCMWPAATCLAYMGLKKIELPKDAERVAKKYMSVVSNIFEETGRLWEKYDANNAKIAVTSEYATMPMMGWTAAVYRYFYEQTMEKS